MGKSSEEKIEQVPVRRFRNSMSEYLYGDAPLEVIRHGHTVGYYFPVQHRSKVTEIAALRSIATQLNELLKHHGVSEDDIVAEFRDLRRAKKQREK